jgi:hypothetical protein
MPLDMAYRLVTRLGLCQSVLRTQLCSRAPPPKLTGQGCGLLQVYEHLRSTFGDKNAVSHYQKMQQKDFLAKA